MKVRIILLLLLSCSTVIPQTNHPTVITGRVIDEQGNPLPHAVVTIIPPPERPRRWVADDSYYFCETDDKGNFNFEDTYPVATKKRFLFVNGPLPVNSYAPITLPHHNLSRINPSLRGRLITIKAKGVINVGDLTVQAHFGMVELQLQDSVGRPSLKTFEDWRGIWLRFHAPEGETIYEGALSILDVERAVRISESIINIALPKGLWRIEVSVEKGDGNLHGTTALLDVVKSNAPFSVVLKLHSVNR